MEPFLGALLVAAFALALSRVGPRVAAWAWLAMPVAGVFVAAGLADWPRWGLSVAAALVLPWSARFFTPRRTTGEVLHLLVWVLPAFFIAARTSMPGTVAVVGILFWGLPLLFAHRLDPELRWLLWGCGLALVAVDLGAAWALLGPTLMVALPLLGQGMRRPSH